MDNPTHALTGLMLARAGLDRLSPRAAWIAVLAANAPDIDVIAAAWGAHVNIAVHRGPTHSLLLVPLMAALPVILLGEARRAGAWVVSIVALLSHLVLDWTNIYGIRLLSPVSDRWFRLDITSVVDPWIWLVLLFGVSWPALSRLVTSEIGARRKSGAGLARAVLIALVAYEGVRYFAHERAVAMLNARVYEGEEARQTAAFPHFADPLRWRGLVETSGAWVTHQIDLRREFDPLAGRVIPKAPPSAAISAARTEPAFHALEHFSQTLFWRESPAPNPDGAVEVTASDLRFGDPGEGRFTARAIVGPDSRVLESGFRFMPPGAWPKPR